MSEIKDKTVQDTIAEEAIEDVIHAQEEEIMSEAKAEQAAEAASQVKEEKDDQQFLRLQADFLNYKKRVEKEKSDIYRLANEKLMTELLPVLDNFERALDHAEESSKASFVEGVEMILKNLVGVLEKQGLKAIDAHNQPFDHNLHHAVITEESSGHDADTVLQVLQKGYTLNDKVIRPSMVKVSQ